MDKSFVHLHLHSDYSSLDGAGRIKDYVHVARELGMPALGLTDHGNLFGAYEFYRECSANGIKPIIGIEFYVAPKSLDHKEPFYYGTPDQRPEDVGGRGAHTHLTAIAATPEGLRNLYRLHEISYARGFYRKPRIDLETLGKYSGGLIVTTGCMGGAVATRLKLGQYELAVEEVQRLLEAVGTNNLFVEVMHHSHPLDDFINAGLYRIASDLNLPLLATNDCHYVNDTDAPIHDSLLCLQTRAKLADGSRFRFEGMGYHLRSRSEMEVLGLPRESLDNTLVLAGRVEDYGEVFAQDLSRMPRAIGVEDADQELWMLAMAWLNDGNWSEEYETRLVYELDVIAKMQFSDYFLVMEDITSYARANGIRIGPGRGSAGGSLVSYALGITSIDPIKHGLLFQRFINPERRGYPDVDLDVSDYRRSDLFSYIRSKYGIGNVAQIITHGRIGAKRALLDSAFVHGYPTAVGRGAVARLPRAVFGRQPNVADGNWKNLSLEETKTLETARGLEGLIRQPGVHAAGVVISSEPLSSILPVWKPVNAVGLVTGYDMNAMEPLGLVKFDLLGLSNLRIIDETLRLLAAAGLSMPDTYDDPRTYSLLSSGHTLGVFQLDSPGMRGLLRRLQPHRFDDIGAVLALYRPGPMGDKAHLEYCNRSYSSLHSELDEALKPILTDTYGLVVFQEQVMRILEVIGGYSLSEASVMLKIFKFKDREKLAEQYEKFKEGGREKGYSDGALQVLWDKIVPFADYAFNKAHATGYAMVAYWTAYLKANHPVFFMAALLDSAQDTPDKLQEYLTECSRLGIRILPPDINLSSGSFTPNSGGITYGLSAIRGVGVKAAGAISGGRPYRDSTDFFKRADKKILNIGVLTALIKAGAMDGLGSREGWLFVAAELGERAVDERQKKSSGQRSLIRSQYSIPEWGIDKTARMAGEQEVLGVALTAVDCTISVMRPLDEWEFEFIRRVIEQNPGNQEVSITFGMTAFALQDKISLNDSVRRSLEAIGGVSVANV